MSLRHLFIIAMASSLVACKTEKSTSGRSPGEMEFSMTVLNGDRLDLGMAGPAEVRLDDVGQGRVGLTLRFSEKGAWTRSHLPFQSQSRDSSFDEQVMAKAMASLGDVHVIAGPKGELERSMFEHRLAFAESLEQQFMADGAKETFERFMEREQMYAFFSRMASWVDGCVVALAASGNCGEFNITRWEQDLPVLVYPMIDGSEKVPARINLVKEDADKGYSCKVSFQYDLKALKSRIPEDQRFQLIADVNHDLVDFVVRFDKDGNPLEITSSVFYGTEHTHFDSSEGSGVWSSAEGRIVFSPSID